MNFISTVKTAVVALALTCSLPAMAGYIDFDDTDAPTLFVETSSLSNYYADVGVLFEGTTGTGGSILDNGGNFSFSAKSGTDFLAFNTGAGTGKTERISFFETQGTVSLFAASGISGTFTLSAFDINDVLLGTTTVDTSTTWQELTLNFAGTASVLFTSTVDVFGIDDLAFGPGTTQVPEPGSIALIGLGLLGFAAARRKSAK